ncbi:hypothetical protein [Zeaxanthinibacter enoshimensis]|uniref:Uncharacterized protein n=1 Tax=Zeaxanthinibacter enoshimensis TaxID=392009 RepID=A0A4R6TP63_9FLAO|nr:hypothetical protein [Zeaxanthinibacter enoshimensis]TDQ33392.1 hypothetical protein CLV82_1231 [Zeaxanthinibacter enoshimensis]
MKYFGVLSRKEYYRRSPARQKTLLVKQHLFETRFRIRLQRNGTIPLVKEQAEEILVPRQEVVLDFYNFLQQQYATEIDHTYLEFFHQFNEEIFGLDQESQKLQALIHYKQLFRAINNGDFQFFRESAGPCGIPQVENSSKLETLQQQQQALQQNLSNSDLFLWYLFGDKEVFSIEKINESPDLHEFVEFERHLKVIIMLNFNYNFEPHLSFDNTATLTTTTQQELLQTQQTEDKGKFTDEMARRYLVERVFGK